MLFSLAFPTSGENGETASSAVTISFGDGLLTSGEVRTGASTSPTSSTFISAVAFLALAALELCLDRRDVRELLFGGDGTGIREAVTCIEDSGLFDGVFRVSGC